jgi:hypothetical protein
VNRNLSKGIAKGMYGAPRGIKGGDYLRANIGNSSGANGVVPTNSVNGNLQGAYAKRNLKNGKK